MANSNDLQPRRPAQGLTEKADPAARAAAKPAPKKATIATGEMIGAAIET